MRESPRTKAELIAEISSLKEKIKKLEKSDAKSKQAESQMEAALADLRKSEEKYKGLTENINLGIYRNTVGPEGKFIEANPAIIGMFGYKSKEEFLDTNVSDLYQDSKDREKFNEKMLKEGVVKGEELWLKRKDGSHFVGSVSAVAVKDGQGQVKYYDGIIDNIDERKRAESQREAALEALQESEERYRALVENASDLVYKTDKTGNFTFLNRAAITIAGYEEGELIGKIYTLVIRPDMCDQAIKHFGRQFVRKIHNTYFELPIITKDGREVWIGQNIQLIVEDGQVTGFQAVARDITERKRVEQALQESEERFRQLSSLTSEGIMIHAGGVILDANQAFAELAGYSKADNLIGKNGVEIISFTAESRQRIIDSLRTGSTETFEVELVRSDGSILSAETHGKEINYRGRQASLVSMRDITERKRAESQREAALEALRESEERFRTLYENSTIGIYRTTPDGSVHLANPALVRMLGYTSFADLATRDLEKSGFEPSYPRTRFIEMIEKDGEVKGLESAWTRKDGAIIFIRENASAIRDAQGKTLYYDGTVEDITARKQAEFQREAALAALRESEAAAATDSVNAADCHLHISA